MKKSYFILLVFIAMLTNVTCKKECPPYVEPCDPNKVCLLYPLNHSENVSRTTGFVWRKFGDIQQYEIEICDRSYIPSEDSAHWFCDKYIVNDTFFYSPEYQLGFLRYLIADYDYTWQVRGIRAVGDTTIWSNPFHFKTSDIRDSLLGEYNVAEIRWDVDYPYPYHEDSTGQNYIARVTKNGETGIHIEIVGKGLAWDMIRWNSLQYKEDTQDMYNASVTFARAAVGINFVPGSEIKITHRNRGNNPPYHYGGEYYEGVRQ